MLAARPHALLRRRRARVVALLAPEEEVLELVHARVGEEQRRIVGGHERGGRHARVALFLEERQERLADLPGGPVGSLHGPEDKGFPPAPPYPGWFEKSKGEAAPCALSASGDSRAPSMSSFATSDVDWMPCTLSLNSLGFVERRMASSSVMRPVL